MKSPTLIPHAPGVALTEKEGMFLENLRRGMPMAAAAFRAGYKNPAQTARALLARPKIQNAVAAMQAEMMDSHYVSRGEVVTLLRAAAEMAQEDRAPSALVRVASELNKMFGHYQMPSDNAAQALSRAMEEAGALSGAESLEDLSDGELEPYAYAPD